MGYIVKFTWENEASVWTATSDDIPGLVLESGSADALIERVRYAVPELLELNHLPKCEFIDFQIERQDRVLAYG